jgi:solute carrier family 25 (mitochondrial thiamine pyrophosphate transporter), member 19
MEDQKGFPKKLRLKSRAALDATAGALAGSVARFVVGPLDVLKIRFQVQLEPIANSSATGHRISHVQVSSKYTSIRQAVQTIVKEEGLLVSEESCL